LDLLEHYITNLRALGTFTETVAEGVQIEPPTTILWSLFLKAHMLEKSGLLLDALAVIDECLGHTPTALDMHIKKARIIRKLGDPVSASQLVDSCRTLDLQDRYLNNKTTKYLLRADNVPQAMDTIAMFTKVNGLLHIATPLLEQTRINVLFIST
jgi:N-alpha-acetyltransferase 15/16, NatA auxiliary subunit